MRKRKHAERAKPEIIRPVYDEMERLDRLDRDRWREELPDGVEDRYEMAEKIARKK